MCLFVSKACIKTILNNSLISRGAWQRALWFPYCQRLALVWVLVFLNCRAFEIGRHRRRAGIKPASAHLGKSAIGAAVFPRGKRCGRRAAGALAFAAAVRWQVPSLIRKYLYQVRCLVSHRNSALRVAHARSCARCPQDRSRQVFIADIFNLIKGIPPFGSDPLLVLLYIQNMQNGGFVSARDRILYAMAYLLYVDSESRT